MNKPKTLIYDIETSPCVGWFWRTGKTNIGAHQIQRPGKIICISYRFTHWKPGLVRNLRWDRKQSDENMVKRFAKIVEKADLIVGHNGDGFDKKWINTRLAYFQQPTISHALTEDTLKQARKEFNLPSFRLDFLCKYFKIPGKLSTASGLWERVVFDNSKKDLDKMVEYCDQDVLILDQLYERIYPYVSHKINLSVFTGERTGCPDCGSKNLTRNGYRYTRTGKFQRLKCGSCGRRSTNGKNQMLRPGGITR